MTTRRTRYANALALSIAALSFPFAHAATVTRTWVGAGGNVNWSNSANWNGSAPAGGGSYNLLFDGTTNTGTAGTPLNNDQINLFITNLTFLPTAGPFVIAGSDLFLKLNGTSTFTQSSSNNQTINNLIWANPNSVKATGSTLILTGDGAGVVTLNGRIDDADVALTITKTGTSTYVFGNISNDLISNTIINGGVLRIAATDSIDSTEGYRAVANAAGTLGIGYQVTNANLQNKVIAAASSGGLALDTGGTWTNALDMSTLGNGAMFLGSSVSTIYGGATLAPGTSSTYRLGTGGGTLTFNTANLLTGSNSLVAFNTASNTFGTIVLAAPNNFTGGTTIAAGILKVSNTSGSATGTGTVTVNGGILASGAVGSISGHVNAGSGSHIIAPGGIGAIGTLSLTGGLTTSTNTTLNFDLSGFTGGDLLNVNGLTVGANSHITFAVNPTVPGNYRLIGGAYGTPTLTNFLLPTAPAGQTYSLSTTVDPGFIDLVCGSANANNSVLSLTSNTAAFGRVMVNALPTQGVTVSRLSGTFSTGFTATPTAGVTATPTASSGTLPPGQTVTVGLTSTLGSRSGSVSVQNTGNDGSGNGSTSGGAGQGNAQSPLIVAVTGTVVDNRVVTATSVNFGAIHAGASPSTSTVLSSATSDTQATRVTVANGSDTIVTLSGGTNPTFNGSASDTRTLSATLNTPGIISATLTLPTTGEGLTGEAPIAVSLPYTVQVFSGKAQWNTVSGSWATQANWKDTLSIVQLGAPGLDGSLSTNDTATFGPTAGSSPLTVSLNGVTPTLSALTFNNASVNYLLAPGTGGSFSLANSSGTIPITVLAGTHAITAPITLNSNANFTITNLADSLTLSAPLSGNASITKSGAGLLTLNTTNTFTGNTTVNAGTLALGVDNALPTVGSLTVNAGTFDISTHSQNLSLITLVTGSLSGTTGLLTGTTYDLRTGTVSAILAGAAPVNKSTPGLLTFLAQNTYSGGTTVSAGTLALAIDNALLTTAPVSVSGGTLDIATHNQLFGPLTLASGSITGTTGVLTATSYTLQSGTSTAILAGPIGVTKSTDGTVVLNANNQYTGTTLIQGGTLSIDRDAALGDPATNAGVTLDADAVTLLATATFSSSRALLFNWSANVAVAAGSTLTLTGILSGDGRLIKADSGTLVLTNNANSQFGTIIQNGTLSISSDLQLGAAGGPITFGGTGLAVDKASPVLQVTSTFTLDRPILISINVVGQSAVIDVTASNTLTLTNSVSDDFGTIAGLAKTGTGTLILSGDSTYILGTQVLGGTLSINRDSNLGNPNGSVTISNATLQSTGTFSTNRAIAITNATLDVTSPNVLTLTGPITGPGGLTKSGAGNLVLTGNNLYSGTTTVTGGKLTAGTASAIPSTSPVLVTGGEFEVGGSPGLYTFNSITLSGSGIASVTSGGDKVLKLPNGAASLAIGSASTLDLRNNAMIVQSTAATLDSDYAILVAYAAAGRHGGAWDGPGGLTSSTAHNVELANAGVEITGLAIVRAADLPGPITQFANQTVDANSLLVKYTYVGDANLSGTLTMDDYLAIDDGYLFGGAGYAHGDFNYDGLINAADYALIDNAFANQGSTTLAAQMIALHTQWFGSAYTAALASLAPVPEPASLSLLALGSLAALTRRRPRRPHH